MSWPAILAAYGSYLVGAALVRRVPKHAVRSSAAFAAAAWALLLLSRTTTWLEAPMVSIWLPAAAVLAAYRATGPLFDRPQTSLERRLLAVDSRVLGGPSGVRALAGLPRVVIEALEASYLLTYAALPAGAVTLHVFGPADALAEYWAIVMASSLTCYGALPWIRTRPPRALEDRDPYAGRPSWFRRINLEVLARGSIHVNTLPSGHAASVTAAAVAVAHHLPAAGAAFGILALMIATAAVTGRYHYVVDSVLGVAIAVGYWLWVGPG